MWSIFKRNKTATPSDSKSTTPAIETTHAPNRQSFDTMSDTTTPLDSSNETHTEVLSNKPSLVEESSSSQIDPSIPAEGTTSIQPTEQTAQTETANLNDLADKTAVATPEKTGFLARLWHQLARTRDKLGSGLKTLLTGKIKLDADTRDELETLLLTADVGLETTNDLLNQLSQRKLKEGEDLYDALATIMVELLHRSQQQPETYPESGPRVILMVGVNGVGKTTTIAKLAHHFLQQNKQLLLAAGDTFRAAAVEQLKTWGSRHQVPVIAQGQDADPASVLYDALSAAKARQVDVMIGDTAGRLHTQGHLMNELKKIHRVIQKQDAQAPHEVWLVIDATTGQNAINQAQQFHAAIGLTGIILTKLDGTAKGGIVFALSSQLGLPIRYIGIGESAEDLRSFEADSFVQALLTQNSPVANGQRA